MRRILSVFILTVLTISQSVWANNTDWYDSSFTEFSIQTAEDLAGLAELVNDGTDFYGCTIVVENDIELDGTPWTPIGYFSNANTNKPFCGTFMGKDSGITIKNLYVEADPAKGLNTLGLFGYVSNGCVIKNITIEEGSVTNDMATGYAGYIGGLVGYANATDGEDIRIENCHNLEVTITGGPTTNSYIGGLIGYIERQDGSVVVTDCTNNGPVGCDTGARSLISGGIIGYSKGQGSLSIINCENKSEITVVSDKSTHAGGIIGSMHDDGYDFSIFNCHNYGEINASGPADDSFVYAAGIAGEIRGKNSMTVIEQSSNHASVSTEGKHLRTSGIVSYITGQANMDIEIKVSYNTGNLSASSMDTSYIGGIVGLGACGAKDQSGVYAGRININNTYSACDIYSTSPDTNKFGYAGGLCGSLQMVDACQGEIKIENSYATGTITGEMRFCGGIAGQLENKTGCSTQINNCMAYFTEEFTASATNRNYRITNNFGNKDANNYVSNNYANIPGDNWKEDLAGKDGGFWAGRMDAQPFFDEEGNQLWDEVWIIDVTGKSMPKLSGVKGQPEVINAPGLPDLSDEDNTIFNPSEVASVIYGDEEIEIPAEFEVIYKGLTLAQGKDYKYTVTDENGDEATSFINAGTYYIAFEGIGAYMGEKKIEFAVIAKDITNSDATTEEISFTAPTDQISINYGSNNELPQSILDQFILNYNGTDLVADDDFTFSYENNNRAGTATLVITGIGNFQGELRHNFTITGSTSYESDSDPVYYTVTVNVIGQGDVEVLGMESDGTAEHFSKLTVNATEWDNFEFYTITVETGQSELELDNNGSFYVRGNTVITVRFMRIDDVDPNTDFGGPTSNASMEENNKVWTSYGKIHVQSDKSDLIRVISINGRVAATRQAQAGETTFDLSSGLYVVVFNNKSVKVQVP